MSKLDANECTRCGLCEEDCPMARSGCTSPATILSGSSQEGSWLCINCWLCAAGCPQNVDIWTASMSLRSREPPPAAVKSFLARIHQYGCAFHIEGLEEIRRMSRLPAVSLIQQRELAILLNKQQGEE